MVFLYSSPIWGPFEALLRPYWSDFGHILERHDLFGHRVWLECFFLEVTNSSFFPFEQKNWRTLFRVLPEAFPRSIKSTHPTIDWHSKCQNKISRFWIIFGQSSAIWVSVECFPSSTWVRLKFAVWGFLGIVNLWAAVCPIHSEVMESCFASPCLHPGHLQDD